MSGYFNTLDTLNFNDTITAYNNYKTQFERIVRDFNNTTRTMTNNWKGKGCNAFERDCRQVQLNLGDISDIMAEIKSALENAREEYCGTDDDLAAYYRSE